MKGCEENEGGRKHAQKKGARRILQKKRTCQRNTEEIPASVSDSERSSAHTCSILAVDRCIAVFFLSWRDITKRGMANNKENF